MTQQQALSTIQNIRDSNGYRETEGDNWLGPRLHALEDYIRSKRNLQDMASTLFQLQDMTTALSLEIKTALDDLEEIEASK